MAIPEPSPELQRWARRNSITATALDSIVERAHEGPTVPPFSGLPSATRRELAVLSLQALTELRELTEEYLAEVRPSPTPGGDPAEASTPEREAVLVPVVTASGRQPRSAWPAMDVLPEAVWIEDVSAGAHPIVYVNQAFTDLTGYSREQAVGTALGEWQAGLAEPSADAALRGVGSSWALVREANEALQGFIAAGRSGSARIVLRHAEGYLLHAQVTLAPVSDGDGDAEVVHYVAVLRSLR